MAETNYKAAGGALVLAAERGLKRGVPGALEALNAAREGVTPERALARAALTVARLRGGH